MRLSTPADVPASPNDPLARARPADRCSVLYLTPSANLRLVGPLEPSN
jgi:hypothetical protein